MCVCFIILAVLLEQLYVNKVIQSITEVIQSLFTGCLVLITGYYAWETAQMSRSSEKSGEVIKIQSQATTKLATETQEQRFDNSRPVLMPTEGSGGIASVSPGVIYAWPGQLLLLKNIGIGPALNITARLEQRSEGSTIVKELNESILTAEPIAAGGGELLRSRSVDIHAGVIHEGDWIVINYYDMFDRQFSTEAQYIKD